MPVVHFLAAYGALISAMYEPYQARPAENVATNRNHRIFVRVQADGAAFFDINPF